MLGARLLGRGWAQSLLFGAGMTAPANLQRPQAPVVGCTVAL